MSVPVWIVVTAAVTIFVLLLATILIFFAWKGMWLMNLELQARLRIVQVDLHGIDWPPSDRPIRRDVERFRLDDGAGR